MKKIAIKNAESKPSQMSPQELEKVFNSLKNKGQVEVWAESVMSMGSLNGLLMTWEERPRARNTTWKRSP